MMRIIYLSIGILLNVCAFSQKHDYNYVETGPINPEREGVIISYIDSLQDIVIDSFNWLGRTNGCPALSSKEGKLLGYTNNLALWDSLGRKAINGDSLAVGYYLNFITEYHPEEKGVAVIQGVGFIPIHDSLFYFFHSSGETWLGAPNWQVDEVKERGIPLYAYSEGLWLTKVRVSSEGRLYIEDNEKKIQLLEDVIGYNQLQFIKQENGEDWWIQVPQVLDDSIHLFSLEKESESLNYLGKKYFSSDNGRVCNTPAMAQSVDGSLLARYYGNCDNNGLWNKIELFDFDRRTGTSKRIWIDSFPEDDYCTYLQDVEFSENGRFLYIGTGGAVYQADLHNDAPLQSMIKIAEWDGFYDGGIPTLMDQFWRLPSGKILVVGLTSDSYIHYINRPNEYGVNCDFQMRARQTPPYSHLPDRRIAITSFPSFPPYRMCPMDGDCDSLTSQTDIPVMDLDVFLSLYPNPAWTETTVQIHGAEIKWARMLDINGRQVAESKGHGRFDVSTLPSGVYFVEVETDRGVFVRKLVIR